MKILVSTKLTQNDRPGDFNFAPDGEPVVSASYAMCDSHRNARGGLSRCGCDRAFRTVETGLATTTAIVAEQDITRDALIETLTKRLMEDWNAPDPEMREIAEPEVDEMLTTAADLPVGVIVGQDVQRIFTR